MFKDLLEVLKDFLKKLVSSRLVTLSVLFIGMFALLTVNLFNLQIVHGEDYLNEYMQKTEKVIYTPGTRGNIFDRNGNVLAYNELAYSVAVQDTGAYQTAQDRNAMLLRLVRILEKHGETVEGEFEVGLDENGEMVYTSSSESARRRFLRDYYNLTTADDLDKDGKNPSGITAREAFEGKFTEYRMDSIVDENGNPVVLSDETALSMVNIWYTMKLTEYRKYEQTTVATNVSDETVAEIMENTADLQGVTIEESSVRVYNNSIYFEPLIGYIGKVQEDQLEELNKGIPEGSNQAYQLTDLVGRTGLEASMEKELQGKKGYKVVNVDNMGRILEVKEEVQAGAGNDLYLSVDQNLQIGVYELLERQLAGILLDHIRMEDIGENETFTASKIPIPIKDVYYQLINNNVLSLSHMGSEEASAMERQLYQIQTSSQEAILENIRAELLSPHATTLEDLPRDMMAYMVYIYEYLASDEVGIIQKSKIDETSEAYLAWKADTISLRDYIYAGIADGWVDTTKLDSDARYSSADSIFENLVDYIIDALKDNRNFTKRIYRYLINDGTVQGWQLCVALFDQGVLEYDEEAIARLSSEGDGYAYTFIREKIENIELTPAQLALDPCTGSCVVVDVNTGEVLALVTYPGYDNNKMSGTVDADYYNQLREDLSLPLRNNATMMVKAPGSTFKPITAIAALEEGVIQLGEMINCTGIYEEIDTPLRCWIYPGSHGLLDIIGGIGNSCNYVMAELAHRMSTDENGNYSASKGLETLKKYATMFGLDHTSGVEIDEASPHISDTDPERSSIGQGSHTFTNTQLARYVTALANRGTVYELSLLDKLTDSEGNLIEDYSPTVSSVIDIQDSTWNAVQAGMRQVIAEGSAKNIFADLPIEIAGKTGTAEETGRTNHAFFISFAPYASPEIAVTVNIPYGYSSGNAATLAKNIYRYYYGYTTLDEIMGVGALDATTVEIQD